MENTLHSLSAFYSLLYSCQYTTVLIILKNNVQELPTFTSNAQLNVVCV